MIGYYNSAAHRRDTEEAARVLEKHRKEDEFRARSGDILSLGANLVARIADHTLRATATAGDITPREKNETPDAFLRRIGYKKD